MCPAFLAQTHRRLRSFSNSTIDSTCQPRCRCVGALGLDAPYGVAAEPPPDAHRALREPTGRCQITQSNVIIEAAMVFVRALKSLHYILAFSMSDSPRTARRVDTCRSASAVRRDAHLADSARSASGDCDRIRRPGVPRARKQFQRAG